MRCGACGTKLDAPGPDWSIHRLDTYDTDWLRTYARKMAKWSYDETDCLAVYWTSDKRAASVKVYEWGVVLSSHHMYEVLKKPHHRRKWKLSALRNALTTVAAFTARVERGKEVNAMMT